MSVLFKRKRSLKRMIRWFSFCLVMHPELLS